jgi:hypothetical protein
MDCRICSNTIELSAKDVEREKYSFLPVDVCTSCIKSALAPVKGMRYCTTCGVICGNTHLKCYSCRNPEYTKVKFFSCKCGATVCNKTKCSEKCDLIYERSKVSFCHLCTKCIPNISRDILYCSSSCARRYEEPMRINT